MQQYDVIENLNPQTRRRYPFLVVLQHDRIYGLSTLVVAPLTDALVLPPLDRLHPIVSVSGRDYRVLVGELAAVHRRTLGRTIASLEGERYALIAALDRLFTGY